MTVRAFFRAVNVENAQPPYDTIHLKVLYPAQLSGSQLERDQGIVPIDPSKAPFPVVIFFGGVNCGAEIYQWLALKLVERGLVVVTFNWIAEPWPDFIALTPGVDLGMLAPGNYGTAPTALALPALLAELENLQNKGILAGMLDLQRIIIGGHSAGGRVVIESASAQFFPQVRAAFAYGAHTAVGESLGYEPATILSLPDSLPLMLMGGTDDGVIMNSGERYNTTWEKPTTPVSRTFQEGIAGGRKDSYLILIEGANHFSIAHPFDATTGRKFLENSGNQPQEPIRSFMAEMVGLFIDAHVRQQPEALVSLGELLKVDNPLIASIECK